MLNLKVMTLFDPDNPPTETDESTDSERSAHADLGGGVDATPKELEQAKKDAYAAKHPDPSGGQANQTEKDAIAGGVEGTRRAIEEANRRAEEARRRIEDHPE